MNTPTETVTLVDLIDRLVEVSPPPPISMWPQTWGWWVVFGLMAVILTAMLVYVVRRYRANAYRRAALAELDTAGDDAAVVARILRRAALTAYPRKKVAHLAGEEWLKFLESTAKGVSFTTQPGSSLAQAPYRPGPGQDGLNGLAQKWVRRHQLRPGA